MIGTVILGLLIGVILYFIGLGILKMNQRSLRKKIKVKIANEQINKKDLIYILKYYSTIKKDINNEGLEYINLAEDKFPDDRQLNAIIFTYYTKNGNFKEALTKIDQQLEKTPNDADTLFAKGFCHHKLNETEEADVFRLRAIENDQSFSKRFYS